MPRARARRYCPRPVRHGSFDFARHAIGFPGSGEPADAAAGAGIEPESADISPRVYFGPPGGKLAENRCGEKYSTPYSSATWSHPDLTRIGVDTVADQIRRNADTDRVAAALGYPTITMWSANIGDSALENATGLIANARNSFRAQQIVLGHANPPTITHCYAQLIDVISTRNLQTVTLNDVFS